MSLIFKAINFGFMIPGLTQVFLWIDSLIYYVADLMFRAFFEMVELSGKISALDSSANYIMRRIMVLAGVYALFRLSLMLINYLVDPDKLSKLTSQGTSIVKNVVIAIILLVSTPLIFSFLGDLQNKIIDSRVIPKVIYGANENVDSTYTNVKESKRFVNNMFLLFFNDKGTCDNYTSEAGGICGAYKRVSEGNAGVSELVGYSILGTFSSFEYTSIFSGIMGIVLCYYFGCYVISMAIRIVKLIVLQILSPIPIIMSIDPAKKDQVTKYAKTYFDVYIQVFVRILMLYLVLVTCSLVANITETIQVNNSTINGITKAIIYIGILKGGKEIPKLLESALGIKADGPGFNGFIAVIKGASGGYVGGIGGTALGAAGARGTGFGNMVAAGLLGGVTGSVRGAEIAAKAKSIGDATSGMVGNLKSQYAMGGNVGKFGAGVWVKSRVQNAVGASEKDKATLDNYDKQINDQQKNIDKVRNSKDISNRANGMRENIERALENGFVNKHKDKTLEYKMANDAKLNELRNTIDINNSNGFYQKNPEYRQIDLDRVANREAELENEYKAEKEKYFNEQLKMSDPNFIGPKTSDYDETIGELLADYNSYIDEHGMSDRKIADYASMNEAGQKASQADRDYDKKIQEEEVKKSQIESDKKAFEGRPDVEARKVTKPEYKASPWKDK